MRSYSTRVSALGCAVLALSLIPAVGSGQQQPSGVVTAVQGRAQLTRPTVASPMALRVKDGVVIRDVIDTQENSLTRILFGGRATVTVRELSRFEVREENLPGGGTRSTIELNSGAALVNVARQLMGPRDEVQIRTPNAVAAVRGSAVFTEVIQPALSAFTQLTGSSLLQCPLPPGVTPPAPPVCPDVPLDENFTTTASGTGANVQINQPTPTPPGRNQQILRTMNAGKGVTEEGSAARTVQESFAEIMALAQAATEIVGGQTGGGSQQATGGTNNSNNNAVAPISATQNCQAGCPGSPSGNGGGGGGGNTGSGIGSYSAISDGGREQYGLNSFGGSGSSSYIAGAKTDLVNFGHTLVAPTQTITDSYLSPIRSFYMGLLGSTPTDAERSSLSNWVKNGGRLFIQQDHTFGSWYQPANALLSDYGFGATDGSASNNHFILSDHPIATNPNNLKNLTFNGAANSKFDPSDIPQGATIFARAGSSEGPITGAVASFGKGKVATTTDIDMWSSAGGYGAGTNNQRLWENIWAFLDGNAAEDPPLYSVANGETFVGPEGAPLIGVSNLSLRFDSALVATGPDARVSLSGPLLKALNGNLTVPFSVLGLHNGARLVSTSNDPLLWLQGGTHELATRTGNSIFHFWGTEAVTDTQTGVEVGTTPSVSHKGVLLEASGGATISTQRVLKVDTALLEATMPVINLLGALNGATSLTTEQSTIDLIKSKLTSVGPVIALDKGLINVKNGPLINITSGSQLITLGDLIKMANQSRINVYNGPLISVAGAGSVLDVGGALVNFGGSGGNKIVVNNSIKPTATMSGLAVSATGGGNISIGGTAVKNPELGTISVTGSLIQATNGGSVTIKGK